MLGEHGIWEKGSFYEASAGVPLFVRWPERFDGKRIDANVTLCDLYRTLCDLADLPVRDGAAPDSRSLVPLLEGDRETWDERHPDDEAVSAEGDRVMVKRGDLKYVSFDGCDWADDGDVLFDLGTDSEERENRIGDPAYADAVAAFERRVAELGYGADGDPDYEDAGYR
jgi:choline-sulfatase